MEQLILHLHVQEQDGRTGIAYGIVTEVSATGIIAAFSKQASDLIDSMPRGSFCWSLVLLLIPSCCRLSPFDFSASDRLDHAA